MAQPDLVEQARQGDASAIARLISRSLTEAGGVAQAHWQGSVLCLALESERRLEPAFIVPMLRQGLERLGLTCPLDAVEIIARHQGQTTPDWRDRIILSTPVAPAAPTAPVVSAATPPATGSVHSFVG
jgi:hypothetical protein